MKLYELAEGFNTLFDSFDAINNWEPDTDSNGQPIDDDGNIIENPVLYKVNMLNAWFDTLESIEGEFDMKAENIAVFIKEIKAEADSLKAEEQSLRKRRQTKERQIDSLKTYLLTQMQEIGKSKIDTQKALISIRNNAPSLVVDDELSFIRWAEQNNDSLLKYSMPEIRKSDVKKAVKAGDEIPFVHMEKSTSVIIK